MVDGGDCRAIEAAERIGAVGRLGSGMEGTFVGSFAEGAAGLLFAADDAEEGLMLSRIQWNQIIGE